MAISLTRIGDIGPTCSLVHVSRVAVWMRQFSLSCQQKSRGSHVGRRPRIHVGRQWSACRHPRDRAMRQYRVHRVPRTWHTEQLLHSVWLFYFLNMKTCVSARTHMYNTVRFMYMHGKHVWFAKLLRFTCMFISNISSRVRVSGRR